MKEWRGNIVTLVQNTVVRRVRVSCKQTYTSPPNDNGCDGILSRSAPESTFVSQLHTFSRRSLEKTLPFREHTKVERVLPTRRATKTATLPG